jgi:hypothetical protein
MLWLLVFLSTLAGCVVQHPPQQTAEPSPSGPLPGVSGTPATIGVQKAATARQQWEYMDSYNTGVIGQDNTGRDIGVDGWELVSVLPPTEADHRYHFCYKRPK